MCKGRAKKAYILFRTKAMQFRFMSDADREGITFGDGIKATERMAEDIMALKGDRKICFLGWAGYMCYHHSKYTATRISYEKSIDGSDEYGISQGMAST